MQEQEVTDLHDSGADIQAHVVSEPHPQLLQSSNASVMQQCASFVSCKKIAVQLSIA